MQRDLEALEIVCQHYDACYSYIALRNEKNRVRVLQRQVTKLEAENALFENANKRWREACQQWRDSYVNVSPHVRSLTLLYARSTGFSARSFTVHQHHWF